MITKYKWHAFLGNMKILFSANNEYVFYHIDGTKQISRPCKIYSQNNGRLYFVAKRKYYYIDKFTML